MCGKPCVAGTLMFQRDHYLLAGSRQVVLYKQPQFPMKVTLITACYNSASTIRTAIDSVLSQKGVEVEYIVIDGGSKDGTVEILKGYEKKFFNLSTFQPFNFRWLSEEDSGMYDAITKGIKMATGDVVGILNADDVLADDETLAHVASAFKTPEVRSQKSTAFMLTFGL